MNFNIDIRTELNGDWGKEELRGNLKSEPGNILWLKEHVGYILIHRADYGGLDQRIRADLYCTNGKRMFTLAKYIVDPKTRFLRPCDWQFKIWSLTADNYETHALEHHYTMTKKLTLTPSCLNALAELAVIATEALQNLTIKEEDIKFDISVTVK